MRSSILVLGAATCEDTAIVVDRLRAIGVPYRSVDVDLDPAALAHLRRLNDGERITPTVILGEDEVVAAEPSLEQLGEMLRAAGHEPTMPGARQLHGSITGRPIPTRTLPAIDGRDFSLERVRGKRQVALLLVHAPSCMACFGYARQLSRHHEAMREAGATTVVVVGGPSADAGEWRHGVGPGTVILADSDGRWKAEIARHLDLPADGTMLFLLDRYLAPRVVSHGHEAGALVDPVEATDWLRFVELDCPECSGEIDWPEDALTV